MVLVQWREGPGLLAISYGRGHKRETKHEHVGGLKAYAIEEGREGLAHGLGRLQDNPRGKKRRRATL